MVEPTNNLTEQALRFVVFDRKLTQGTCSDKGQSWCERIWSVLATGRLHQRFAFVFISEAVQARFQQRQAPFRSPWREGLLSINDAGELVVDLGGNWDPVVDAAPYVYQVIDGKEAVAHPLAELVERAIVRSWT